MPCFHLVLRHAFGDPIMNGQLRCISVLKSSGRFKGSLADSVSKCFFDYLCGFHKILIPGGNRAYAIPQFI